MCLSAHLFIYQSIYISNYLYYTTIYLSIDRSIDLSIYLPTGLSIDLSIWLSTHSANYLSVVFLSVDHILRLLGKLNPAKTYENMSLGNPPKCLVGIDKIFDATKRK